MQKFRVKEYGVQSYWPHSMAATQKTVKTITDRNGCGCIEEQQADKTWKITYRFDRHYGIVAA